jgi:hypothetical protein
MLALLSIENVHVLLSVHEAVLFLPQCVVVLALQFMYSAAASCCQCISDRYTV